MRVRALGEHGPEFIRCNTSCTATADERVASLLSTQHLGLRHSTTSCKRTSGIEASISGSDDSSVAGVDAAAASAAPWPLLRFARAGALLFDNILRSTLFLIAPTVLLNAPTILSPNDDRQRALAVPVLPPQITLQNQLVLWGHDESALVSQSAPIGVCFVHETKPALWQIDLAFLATFHSFVLIQELVTCGAIP